MCFPTAAGVAAFDVQPNMPPEETLAGARHAWPAGHLAALVLVLTDVFGATPCNVAQKLVDGVNSKLIAGVNLPMLLRTVTYRHESLDSLVARLAGGTQGVMQVAMTAPQNQATKKNDQRPPRPSAISWACTPGPRPS